MVNRFLNKQNFRENYVCIYYQNKIIKRKYEHNLLKICCFSSEDFIKYIQYIFIMYKKCCKI